AARAHRSRRTSSARRARIGRRERLAGCAGRDPTGRRRRRGRATAAEPGRHRQRDRAFYGKDNALKLTGLLKQHIMIAVELVEAAKSGNEERFATHDKKWSENAREIAKFLANANPNWAEAELYDLLDQHLRLTKGEVTARLKKDWRADVKAFDDIFTEIMVFADTLTNGLVKQFPSKFAHAEVDERIETEA